MEFPGGKTGQQLPLLHTAARSSRKRAASLPGQVGVSATGCRGQVPRFVSPRSLALSGKGTPACGRLSVHPTNGLPLKKTTPKRPRTNNPQSASQVPVSVHRPLYHEAFSHSSLPAVWGHTPAPSPPFHRSHAGNHAQRSQALGSVQPPASQPSDPSSH